MQHDLVPLPAGRCVIFIHRNEYSVMKSRVGIVGYRGYSGAELVRLLERHALVTPVLLDHRDAPQKPALRRQMGPERFQLSAQAVREQELAVVFLATPPEASMELAPMLLDAGARVVDLS